MGRGVAKESLPLRRSAGEEGFDLDTNVNVLFSDGKSVFATMVGSASWWYNGRGTQAETGVVERNNPLAMTNHKVG